MQDQDSYDTSNPRAVRDLKRKVNDEPENSAAGDRPCGVVSNEHRCSEVGEIYSMVARCATLSARTTRVRNGAAVLDGRVKGQIRKL